jgi:small subunit ribosomal protein S21
MLKIKVKKGNLENSIKELKKKFIDTKVSNECRDRKEFEKKSVKKRKKLNKSKYLQQKTK